MTLRAGISGCGPSGRALVAAARVAGLGSVIAAHGDDDAALATLRSATPVGPATTDFAALLATGVDFVVLAGPLAARLAQVRAAAEQAVAGTATAPLAASAAELAKPEPTSTFGCPARSIARPQKGALTAVASANAPVTTPATE